MQNSSSNKMSGFKYSLKKNIFILLHKKEYALLNSNIFITYSMGKVGSSSIEAALSKRIFYNKNFHLHFLSKAGLKKSEEFNKTDAANKIADQFEQDRKSNPKKKIKVITLVRDPVARDISDLFENNQIYIPEQTKSGIEIVKMTDFFKNFDHDYGLDWFDEELKEYLSIDIYKYAFEKEKGYQIISNPEADILILRLEDLSRVFQKAMFEFTGVKNWKLPVEANDAKNKSYADLYKKFKKSVIIEERIFDKLYNSKFFGHFYTEEEKNAFILKWKKNNSR